MIQVGAAPTLAGEMIDLDPHKRRMGITAQGEFSGAAVSHAVADLTRKQPETASYDFVMDVRRTTTGSTLADFQIVLAAYRDAPRTSEVKYGCFVSHETAYEFWAASMGALFGDRTCLVFASPEDAHAFLDAKRAELPTA